MGAKCLKIMVEYNHSKGNDRNKNNVIKTKNRFSKTVFYRKIT